jgi:hypothetical protein
LDVAEGIDLIASNETTRRMGPGAEAGTTISEIERESLDQVKHVVRSFAQQDVVAINNNHQPLITISKCYRVVQEPNPGELSIGSPKKARAAVATLRDIVRMTGNDDMSKTSHAPDVCEGAASQ